MNNVTLRLSFQSPIQVIENASIDGLIDKISGISGPLILGTSPDIGTAFNKILVNEKFIDDYYADPNNKITKKTKSVNLIDDEL
jgi:hypothetical protein